MPDENFDFYKVGPSNSLINATDSYKIRKALKQIQGAANQFFSKHDRGRINCTTVDYNIFISRLESSLVVNIKKRASGDVLLSQRIKVGDCIIV